MCRVCGKQPPLPDIKSCGPCTERRKEIDADRRARIKAAGKCKDCYRLKAECKCRRPRPRTDVEREAARLKYRLQAVIDKLMKELYGACWPRPHCANSCQSPQFDQGTPGIWYKRKYCVTCAVLTWDWICMCCRHKTVALHNRSEIIRQRWQVAEQVEAGVIPLNTPEPVEVPKTYCYFCGQESRQVICTICLPKASAAGADTESVYARGADNKFAKRRTKDAHHAHNIHDAKFERPQHEQRSTSRVAAISKRNAYAGPPPEISTLKDADKKFDAVARVKERKEHRPAEQVDPL